MIQLATIVCLVLGLLTASAGGVRALRDRPVGVVELAVAGVLEASVLWYVVVRVVDLAGGHRTSSLAVSIAYLIGIVATMPVTAALALAERSRWGPVVLAAGGLVVCVLLARIDQVWTPGG